MYSNDHDHDNDSTDPRHRDVDPAAFRHDGKVTLFLPRERSAYITSNYSVPLAEVR